MNNASVDKLVKSSSLNLDAVEHCRFESDQRHKVYAYVLGCYLGDGYISTGKYTKKLSIYQNAKHVNLIDEQKQALRELFPERSVNVAKSGSGCVVIYVYGKDLCSLFPQHGPGRKHERPIKLSDWQQNIVDSYLQDFIRGLLHTDGCRYVARQVKGEQTYEYVRYAFSNRSLDIIELFEGACHALEVETNRVRVAHGTNRGGIYHVDVNKRSSVAILDEFIKF